MITDDAKTKRCPFTFSSALGLSTCLTNTCMAWVDTTGIQKRDHGYCALIVNGDLQRPVPRQQWVREYSYSKAKDTGDNE
jgi:hypothetical protein